MAKTLLVTGGAGFIGSNFAIHAIQQGDRVVILDKLTYAGNRHNISPIESSAQLTFIEGDIVDQTLVKQLFSTYFFDWVVHFAAESHVDNSIHSPRQFIDTNIVGTFVLLQEALDFYRQGTQKNFRFLHVSTDEVYGELGPDGAFTELSPYAPNSPYSASKAASDHLARAWHHTYGLPVIITNCSNNFGPRQHAEKLIPTVIRCALAGAPIPVYGNGSNVRDWLYVEDHCQGIRQALEKGRIGESYGFGGECEKSNIALVTAICETLDRTMPRPAGSYREYITYVTDRLGHDWRYAIDCSKAKRELGFVPSTDFAKRLQQTIEWYIRHG